MRNPNCLHALLGMKLAEKYKEKPDICNAIGAHHDETEMTSLLAPIVQVCDAISGARPGARREIVEAYIKRLNDLEQLALSYPGVLKTYAIQAGPRIAGDCRSRQDRRCRNRKLVYRNCKTYSRRDDLSRSGEDYRYPGNSGCKFRQITRRRHTAPL